MTMLFSLLVLVLAAPSSDLLLIDVVIQDVFFFDGWATGWQLCALRMLCATYGYLP